MSDPYVDLQNYQPGAGKQSWSITTTPSSSPTALTAGHWYEVRTTVASTIALAALTTAASTSGEYLPADEWSLTFQARSGLVLGVKGTASGTAYLRRVGFGAR